MTKRHTSLGRFCTRAGAFLVSGALAASLTPALALADEGSVATTLTASGANMTAQHYEGNTNNNTGKAIISDTDPLGGGVKLISHKGNVTQYMGYAHNDGQHYHAYSLYTEITTDDNGVITAIDLTSGNDTFAGKWGYYKGKNAAPVEGFLPDGVTFQANKNSDGTWTPILNGADGYGYRLEKVLISSVSVNDKGDTFASDGESEAVIDDVASKTEANGIVKITIPSHKSDDGSEEDPDFYNLVKCTYTIGIGDNLQFNTYFTVGSRSGKADDYIDTIPEDTWTEEPGSSTYNTNRDGWTALMATLSLRMLSSWGAGLADESLVNGLEGEMAAVDTVSGATKTAIPFVGALNAAREAGYVTGVSENVKFTIDGKNAADAKSLAAIDVVDNTATEGNTGSQDYAQVVKNDNGTYTLTMNLRRYGGGRLTLKSINAYELGDQKVGTTGMWTLAKQAATPTADSNAYKAVATYTPPASDSSGGSGSGSGSGKGSGSGSGSGRGGGGGGQGTTWPDSDYDLITLANATFANNDPCTCVVTTKDPKVTHVTFNFEFGHGDAGVAYDLEAMSKVPEVTKALTTANAENPNTVAEARKIWEETPYDVRPFTTGIDNLQKQEAALVSSDIANVSTEDGYAAAKAAYDALDANAKAQLSAQDRAAMEAAIAKHTIASVKVASTQLAYIGAALKPAVNVIAADGSTVAAANYDVAYADNTAVGTASVTVAGKGNYTGSAKSTFAIERAAQTISASNATKTFGNAAFALGAKLTKGDGKLTYVSSNTKVATVDAAGKVTIKGAGKATITVTASQTANYAKATKSVAVTVNKAANPLAVSAKTATVKFKKVKKKTQTLAVSKVVKTSKKGQGTITYAKKSGNKKITINKKTGKVTVKKGLKKGTYKVKVAIKAAGNANYKDVTKTITFKVKVK